MLPLLLDSDRSGYCTVKGIVLEDYYESRDSMPAVPWQPIASAAELSVSGRLVVARQATSPSLRALREVAVSERTRVTISSAVKGCRPNVKVYTDLEAAAGSASVSYGIGLEPITMQVRGFGFSLGVLGWFVRRSWRRQWRRRPVAMLAGIICRVWGFLAVAPWD
jgi:hypothetical protein